MHRTLYLIQAMCEFVIYRFEERRLCKNNALVAKAAFLFYYELKHKLWRKNGLEEVDEKLKGNPALDQQFGCVVEAIQRTRTEDATYRALPLDLGHMTRILGWLDSNECTCSFLGL
jgi:hypothetical protein